MTGAWRYRWDWATCRKIWHWYPVVSKAERPFALAPACIRAAALALPLALPGAAFAPVPHGGVAFGGPVLSGSAYEIGALFVPGVYEIPLRDVSRWRTAAVPAGATPAEGGAWMLPAATGGYPVTPMLSGDVPHWLPDREAGQEVPPTSVPEPASWLLLVAVGVVWWIVKGERG